MNFTVTEGTVATAQKVILYGPEGIGKTSLARQWPGPVFIDTEDSSKQYPVRRLTLPDGSTRPTSWTMLLDMVTAVRDGAVPGIQTLIVDSLDWAETLCIQHICSKHQKSGIEEFGYGKGYTYLEEEFGKLLNYLSEVAAKKIHVVCTAHAQLRRVELPEETGAYDHWEMKLERRDAALAKEWADMVLFLNYKTLVTKGANPMEKNKATGGKRLIHTAHTPWWDAKNRHSLPEELPLAFEGIAHLFNPALLEAAPQSTPAPAPQPAQVTAPIPAAPVQQTAKTEAPAQTAPSAFTEIPDGPDDDLPFKIEPDPPELPACIPKSLADLMKAEKMTTADLQAVIYKAKCYPADTPIENMDPEFFGYLVSIWPQAREMHHEIKEGK